MMRSLLRYNCTELTHIPICNVQRLRERCTLARAKLIGGIGLTDLCHRYRFKAGELVFGFPCMMQGTDAGRLP